MTFRTAFKVPMVMRTNPETGRTQCVQLPHTAGKVAHVVRLMNNDPARNAMIGKLGAMAFSKGRRIVAFTDQLDHVEAIIAELRRNGVPNDEIARYIGGLPQKAYESAKTRRFLVATWGMFSTGTDIPWLDTAILCTPRSDVRQAVGRILREYHDKKEPLVIDLIDADSKVFAGYAAKRRLWFKSIGSDIRDN